jgi:hypothetical protein
VGASHTLDLAADWQDTQVSEVTVILNLSGDWLGDLYVRLNHNGQQAVLLNRVGRTALEPFGYDEGAMNVRLNDAAAQGRVFCFGVEASCFGVAPDDLHRLGATDSGSLAIQSALSPLRNLGLGWTKPIASGCW